MNILTKRTITELRTDEPYLLRWSLWLPFGWSIKVHQILRPDMDRCTHSHPWWMIRVILKGGYVEDRGTGELHWLKPWRPWAPWRVYPIYGEFKHRIVALRDKSSWTLALCGPNSGTWGFYTKHGWMYWEDFVKEAWAYRVLWCDDGRQI